jgi:hypothetical protein
MRPEACVAALQRMGRLFGYVDNFRIGRDSLPLVPAMFECSRRVGTVDMRISSPGFTWIDSPAEAGP